MNSFIQQMVNQKVKQLTPNELIQYATMYNINITPEEARKIIRILKQEKQINIYDSKQHKKIIDKIANRINKDLAKKANELLQQFSKMM